MHSVATPLTISGVSIGKFPIQLKQAACLLEKTPGFCHYRLILTNSKQKRCTLITFWASRAAAKQGKPIIEAVVCQGCRRSRLPTKLNQH